MSPVGYVTFSAGTHYVSLSAYSESTSCVVQGQDQITGGAAYMIGTEFWF